MTYSWHLGAGAGQFQQGLGKPRLHCTWVTQIKKEGDVGKEVREAGKEEGKKDNLKMENVSLSLQSAIPY